MTKGASADADRAVVNGAGQAVSAVPASVPSAWVVTRSVGEYSDRYESPVAIAATEGDAQAYILAADEQWRVATTSLPGACWDTQDDGEIWAAKYAAILTVDPGSAPSGWGRAEQPYYSCHEVPVLNAQAIEARRAETQGGSVNESAVGSADAPNPAPNPRGSTQEREG